MKKLLILLIFIPALSFAQFPETQTVWPWSGSIEKIDSLTLTDTIVQGFFGENKEVIGLWCSCTFDVSDLNGDSSVIKFGGSNIFLQKKRDFYQGFKPYSDSLILDTASFEVFNLRGVNDTLRYRIYQRENMGFQKPMFKWILNDVTEGTLRWNCLFYRKY